MAVELKRVIEWEPAFDKRDPDPGKNHGVHGMEIRFLLKGPDLVVQFLISTNWQLEHVWREWEVKEDFNPRRDKYKHLLCRPMGADLGRHSTTPLYESERMVSKKCEYLDDRPCYYDGSGLNAEELLKKLIAEGEEPVWKRMTEAYEYWSKRQAEARAEGVVGLPYQTHQEMMKSFREFTARMQVEVEKRAEKKDGLPDA